MINKNCNNGSYNKYLPKKDDCVHRHTSKCFITEVLRHGITFIMEKNAHNIAIRSTVESILPIDEGYAEDSESSKPWIIGSDTDEARISATSSEGFEEMDTSPKTISPSESVLSGLYSDLGFSLCNDCNSLPQLSDSFYRSLDSLLLYFQDKYHSCPLLAIDNVSLQRQDKDGRHCHEQLYKIYEALFSDRINWGRIVVMIGFVGELSVSAVNCNRADLIEEYVTTTVCYIHEHLMSWIVAHGGWEGLVDFQLGHNSDYTDLDNMAGNIGRIVGMAALALVGVIICKYIVNHI